MFNANEKALSISAHSSTVDKMKKRVGESFLNEFLFPPRGVGILSSRRKKKGGNKPVAFSREEGLFLCIPHPFLRRMAATHASFIRTQEGIIRRRALSGECPDAVLAQLAELQSTVADLRRELHELRRHVAYVNPDAVFQIGQRVCKVEDTLLAREMWAAQHERHHREEHGCHLSTAARVPPPGEVSRSRRRMVNKEESGAASRKSSSSPRRPSHGTEAVASSTNTTALQLSLRGAAIATTTTPPISQPGTPRAGGVSAIASLDWSAALGLSNAAAPEEGIMLSSANSSGSVDRCVVESRGKAKNRRRQRRRQKGSSDNEFDDESPMEGQSSLAMARLLLAVLYDHEFLRRLLVTSEADLTATSASMVDVSVIQAQRGDDDDDDDKDADGGRKNVDRCKKRRGVNGHRPAATQIEVESTTGSQASLKPIPTFLVAISDPGSHCGVPAPVTEKAIDDNALLLSESSSTTTSAAASQRSMVTGVGDPVDAAPVAAGACAVPSPHHHVVAPPTDAPDHHQLKDLFIRDAKKRFVSVVCPALLAVERTIIRAEQRRQLAARERSDRDLIVAFEREAFIEFIAAAARRAVAWALASSSEQATAPRGERSQRGVVERALGSGAIYLERPRDAGLENDKNDECLPSRGLHEGPQSFRRGVWRFGTSKLTGSGPTSSVEDAGSKLPRNMSSDAAEVAGVIRPGEDDEDDASARDGWCTWLLSSPRWMAACRRGAKHTARQATVE